VTKLNDSTMPPPLKRRWFRRSPEAVTTTLMCPRCKVVGPAQLLPGQVCVPCQTQQAWTELGRSGLVIDAATIEQALQARRGEAAGESMW
jgi:hypothetical protein